MLLNSVKYKARLCTGLLSNTPCAPTWPPHTRVHANRRIYLQLLLLWTLRASLYLYWRGIITICEEYRLQWLQLLTQHISIVIYCSTGRNIVSSASPSRHIYPAIACLKPFCSEMRFISAFPNIEPITSRPHLRVLPILLYPLLFRVFWSSALI